MVAVLATSASADDDMRTDLHARVDRDAGSGRSYFAATALTAPAGSVTATIRLPIYTAVAGSLGVAVADRVELFLGGGAFDQYGSELSVLRKVIGGGVKVQLVRARRWAIAASASLHSRAAYFQPESNAPSYDVPRNTSVEAGVQGTRCLDDRCEAIGSVHAHFLPEVAGDDQVRVWAGVSIVARRFVMDVSVVGQDDTGAFLGYAGYRAAGRRISLDVGALFVGADGVLIPWPTLGLSARF